MVLLWREFVCWLLGHKWESKGAVKGTPDFTQYQCRRCGVGALR